MSKPIFVVAMPSRSSIEDFIQAEIILKKKLKDYHVLVYISLFEDFKFEVFNSDGLPPISIEELKDIIENKTPTT